jgi:hypothetical protein
MLCLAAGAKPCNCPSSGIDDLALPFPFKKQELKLSENAAKSINVKYPFI